MGTSSSYPGPSGTNPLIPSWLESVPTEPNPEQAADPQAPNDEQGSPPSQSPDENQPTPTPPPPTADPYRFAASRGALSRFVSSGGKDARQLGRAVSSYVSKASGGAGGAARRMGASRAAAGRLVGFLADVQARGAAEALRSLNLGSLVGRSADEIFMGLAEYVCPSEGDVDAGIARDAYAETLVEIVEAGIESLESLTGEQVRVVLESFLANSIFIKLCSDIGKGVVQTPKDPKASAFIQDQMKDYIKGAVSDAVERTVGASGSLGKAEAMNLSTALYRQSFAVLQAYGEAQ